MKHLMSPQETKDVGAHIFVAWVGLEKWASLCVAKGCRSMADESC